MTAPSRGRVDGGTVPEDHVIVLFGAFGDLAKRKLLPGLFHLHTAGLMPEGFRIIGTSRRERPDHEFRELARNAVGDGADPDAWERFAARLTAAAFRPDGTESLTKVVQHAESQLSGRPRRLLYLSVPPGASRTWSRRSARAALTSGPEWSSRSRLEPTFRAPGASTPSSAGCSPRIACTGSTISSAARRSRT